MTREVRRLMAELVDAVITDRADGAIVRPVLTAMVQTAVNDFGRYYDGRHASNRVRDFDILNARYKAAKKQSQLSEGRP